MIVVEMKKQKPCKLIDCPPGLFLYDEDSIGFIPEDQEGEGWYDSRGQFYHSDVRIVCPLVVGEVLV